VGQFEFSYRDNSRQNSNWPTTALRRRLAGFPARCHRAVPPAVYSLWHFP